MFLSPCLILPQNHFRILKSGLKDQTHRHEKENQFVKGEECLNEYNSQESEAREIVSCLSCSRRLLEGQLQVTEMQISLSIKGTLSAHEIGESTLVSGWAGPRVHMVSLGTCVCTHVCIHLSSHLVQLLAGWAHSQAGSLGQLQTQVVLLSPRGEAPSPSFSVDPCPAPCRPLAHPPLPDGEWRVPVPSLGPVPVPCGEAGGVCDRGPSCRAVSQRKRCWEVKIRGRSDSWGCWNLKDE